MAVFRIVVQELQALRIVAVKVAFEQFQHFRLAQVPLIENLLADDRQRIHEIRKPHERALHPVVARTALLDVLPALQAVVGEDALERPPPAAVALSAPAVLIGDTVADLRREICLVSIKKGVEIRIFRFERLQKDAA